MALPAVDDSVAAKKAGSESPAVREVQLGQPQPKQPSALCADHEAPAPPEPEVPSGEFVAPTVALWRAEVATQLQLSLPLAAFNLLQFCVGTITLAVVGARTGGVSLAAAALAVSFTNVTGLSLIIGISLTLESLATQAFGAGSYGALGIYYQRAVLLCSVPAAAMSVLWSCMGAVLRGAGQDPAVAALAGAFGRHLVPRLWLMALAVPMQKVLAAQGVMRPMGAVGAAAAAFHYAATVALVRRVGFLGAADALVLTDAVTLGLTAAVYAAHERALPPERRSWRGVSRLALRDLRGYVALALPTTLMLALEWWSFEASVLLSGILPNAETGVSQGAMAIVVNLLMVAFSLPLGLSNGAATRVGNALGAGRPEEARFAAWTGVSLAGLLALAVVVTILAGGEWYGERFTPRGEEGAGVRAAFRRCVPFIACVVVGDGLQAVLSGVVRGCGQQRIGAAVNLLAYNLLGIPTGAVLAFRTRLRVAGLVCGLALATSTQASLYLLWMSRADWRAEACKAVALAASAEEAMARGGSVERGGGGGAAAAALAGCCRGWRQRLGCAAGQTGRRATSA